MARSAVESERAAEAIRAAGCRERWRAGGAEVARVLRFATGLLRQAAPGHLLLFLALSLLIVEEGTHAIHIARKGFYAR